MSAAESTALQRGNTMSKLGGNRRKSDFFSMKNLAPAIEIGTFDGEDTRERILSDHKIEVGSSKADNRSYKRSHLGQAPRTTLDSVQI